jgi:hypothetical protein
MRHHDTNGNHDALGLLADALAEAPDETTEVFGPPETWPAWPDDLVVGVGPAFFREESFDDPDQLPGEELPDEFALTGPEDLALLRQVERTSWQDFLSTPAEPQP